jgi:hypothetical protein
MNRWLRVVLPGWVPWSAGLLAPYLLGQAFIVYLSWGYEFGERPIRGREFLPYLGFVVVIYGVYRVVAFHPALRGGYSRWLQATPWTAARPLPLGPVHLVGQDVVLVGGLMLLVWCFQGHDALVLAPVFLCAYLLPLAGYLALTGEVGFAFAVAFGVGLTVRLMFDPTLALAAALGTYGVAYAGLRQSLARFPWNLDRLEEHGLKVNPKGQALPGGNELGWPFAVLNPEPRAAGITTRDALLTAALAGWWAYVLLSLLPRTSDREPGEVLLALTAWLSLPTVRLLVYYIRFQPPISAWGRLRTGRWFFPRYDRIFVAPLLAWAAGATAFVGLSVVGFQGDVVAAAVLTVTLAVVLAVGPSRREWLLTGRHRIVVIPDPACVKQGGVNVGG